MDVLLGWSSIAAGFNDIPAIVSNPGSAVYALVADFERPSGSGITAGYRLPRRLQGSQICAPLRAGIAA
ncbi:hypothetical protein [Couchioplanes caeruleus]|uniref:hypothetical protein n=1 Tax=Couchioplanes caeruleus TaxID=56438 RepID=UPI000A9F737D|nr:hypothetical protein [Couchioplanes caeruleus]